MFHDIPTAILQRMRQLEALDAQDRKDGTPQAMRLRQIPPETGRFIALLAAAAPQGSFLEVGTSAGYSSLWLALACRELGRTLVTFEILPAKAQLARETFDQAQVEDVVALIQGDARELLDRYGEVAFCFLDAEKEAYQACYELVIPRMVPGGLLVADNAINHREALGAMLQRALSDERVDGQIVPVGKGVLVCRRRFSTLAGGVKAIGGR